MFKRFTFLLQDLESIMLAQPWYRAFSFLMKDTIPVAEKYSALSEFMPRFSCLASAKVFMFEPAPKSAPPAPPRLPETVRLVRLALAPSDSYHPFNWWHWSMSGLS